MPVNERFTEYCRQVSEQIRWRRMRGIVARELEQHLCDQQDAYIEQGHEADEAAQMAVEQMGDARMVGEALDRAHRPQTPWLPMVLILLLLAAGLTLQSLMQPHELPLVHYGIAAILFLLGYFTDVTWLGRHAGKVYGLALAGTLLAVFCAFRSNIADGIAVLPLLQFYIMLGNLSLIFPVVYGLLIYRMRNSGVGGIILCGLAYLPFAVILIVVPSFIGYLIYTIAALVLLCTAIWQGWFQVRRSRGMAMVLIPTLVCVGRALAYIAASPRFQATLNPWLDPDGYGYLNGRLRELLSQSVFWGRGTGDISLIPNLETDHALIFGIHSFGWGAFLALMLLVVGLCIYCVCRGLRQHSMLGKLVVLAVSTTFALQVLSYGLSNLGYNLFGAISFPFVSYGGTALVLNALLMGCMLSVFRAGPWMCDPIAPSGAPCKRA